MAVFFPDADALFIHFPKTGGTWVDEASQQAGISMVRLPHRTSPKLHKHLPRDHYDCSASFAWAVIRRPDDWYVSWFRYARDRGWPDYKQTTAHPQSCLAACAADTFDEFIRNCLRRQRGYLSRMYASYTDGLDFVGTTENLVADIRRALKPRMNLPRFDPRPIYATEGPIPMWAAGLREQLLEAEQEAMRLWKKAFFAGTGEQQSLRTAA
jgi:hypothetical protein